MTAYDFRAAARGKLKNKYLPAFGVCLAAAVLLSFGASTSGSATLSDLTSLVVNGGRLGLLLNSVFTGIIACLSVVSWLISGAVTIGRAHYFLKRVDGEKAGLETLFGYFAHFGTSVLMTLLITAFTALWVAPAVILTAVLVLAVLTTGATAAIVDTESFVAFVEERPALIPVVVLAVAALAALTVVLAAVAWLRYSMTPYILAEHPELGAWGALKLSVALMRGNLGRLLALRLSFAGWYLLSMICSLGLANVFITPYYLAAEAEFFNEISGKNVEKSLREACRRGEYRPQSFDPADFAGFPADAADFGQIS